MSKDKEKETTKAVDSSLEVPSNDGMDIEPLLQALGHGGVGTYQFIQAFLQLFSLFQVAYSIMEHVFIGFKPQYQCATVNDTKVEALIGWTGNTSGTMAIEYAQCNIFVKMNDSGQTEVFSLPCVDGYVYDSPRKDSTIFTEWDLTCEKSALTEASQTLMMMGQALGAFSLTAVADRFGRKPVYVTCSLGMLATAVGVALAPNLIVFILLRVIQGALQQGTGLVAYTMFVEQLPKNYRRMAGVIDGGAWALAIMTLPGLAYLLQDHSWRHLQYAITVFSLYSLILPWALDESLRWLVANKKRDRAEQVLKRACRTNKVPYHKVLPVLDAMFNGQPITDVDSSPTVPMTDDITETLISNTTAEMSPNLRLDENGTETPMNGNLPTNAEMEKPANLRTDKHGFEGAVNGTLHTDGLTEKSKMLPLDKTSEEDPMNVKLLHDEKIEIEDKPKKLPLDETEPVIYEISGELNGSGEVKKYTTLDIFRSPLMMKITFSITYLWVANGMTYYGLMMTSATVAGNRFLNFFLQGLMEFPAYVTVFFCLRRFGRKTVTTAFLSLGGFSLLLSAVLLATVKSPVVGPITNVLSLMGKYGITGSFSALFIMCPEVFPTNLRNAGLGLSSSFARIGGMVAPFSYNLAKVALWAPAALFGAMTLLGTLILRHIPETRGRPMPTTIEDVKLLYLPLDAANCQDGLMHRGEKEAKVPSTVV